MNLSCFRGDFGGDFGQVSVDFFIFAVLLLVNGLLALAMLLAARTLGQPKMALLLAGAFGGNVLLYASDAIYFFFLHDNIWVNLLVSWFAMTPPILAAMAYRLRSGLPYRTVPLFATQAAGLLLILWFSVGDPNYGLRNAIVPFYAAAILLFGVTTALWHPGRELRLGERPIIFTSFGLAAVELGGGLALAAMGNGESAFLDQVYTYVVFLGLPAMTVGAGIFSLYLMGGDLAEKLRLTAETDSLTGAPNRRAVEATGMRMIQEARSTGQPLSVAICDVDHFKDINDLYGHGHGDEVLRSLTGLFREQLAETDHYGRVGGEEFVLFFPACDVDSARTLVEALRARVMAIQIGDLPLRLTASFGVAAMNAGDHILSDILKRADRALYTSKENGRNRTTVDRQPQSAA